MLYPVTAKNVVFADVFYTMFENTFYAGYEFLGEKHNFWEMFYVMDGRATVNADGRVYNMGKDEVIFHKPMEFHKFNVEEDNTKCFIMTFELKGEFAQEFECRVCKAEKKQKDAFMHMRGFLYNNFLNEEKKKDGNVLDYIFTFQNLAKAQAVRNMFENFLITLLLDKTTPSSLDTSADAAVYAKAVKVMNENVRGWLAVPEIAQKCGVSLTYLKSIFSKYAGIGIHKQYINIKLQLAATLMAEGMSVTDAANELNFSSQNYFSMVFKRENGISPTEFIKRGRI